MTARAILLACLPALMAASCDTRPDLPAPLITEVRVVEVPKIVKVPCVRTTDIPTDSLTSMPDPDTADVAQLANGAHADVVALRRDREVLRAALVACAQPQPPEGTKP